MMDEEEVVISEGEQEEQQQVQKPKKSLKERYDNTVDNVRQVGKTVENVGKAEEKAADLLDGGKKGTEAVTNAGKAPSQAIETGSKVAEGASKAGEAAGKATEAAGKATEAAGKATKAAGQATKATGQATQAVGNAASTAGDAVNAAGLAADATIVGAPVGVAANAAGTVASVGGKIASGTGAATTAAGQATEAAGAAEEASGKATQAAGKAEQAAAKAGDAAAKAGETAGKTGKEANDLANKAAKNDTLSDKLRKRGKLNQARGKRIQDVANKFDSDKLFKDNFEKLGKTGELLEKLVKGVISLFNPLTICVIFLLIIILGSMLLIYILSPSFLMQQLKGTIADPNQVEKANNFIRGLGFRDSEEAFYNEVNYLNTHYGNEIDFTYIMSTLYYTDIFYGSDYLSESENDKCESIRDKDDQTLVKICDTLQVGVGLAKMFLKESRTTEGTLGLTYSANKIYRLRDLAKHQFLGGKQTKTKDLDDYIDECVERMGNEFKNIANYIPLLIVRCVIYAINPELGIAFDTLSKSNQLLQDLYDIVDGTENWYSIQLMIENGSYDGIPDALKNLIETFFNCFAEIKDIDFDFDSFKESITDIFTDLNIFDDSGGVSISYDSNGIVLEFDLDDFADEIYDILGSVEIEYYDYSFDEEKFEDYLADEYIRYMPEFSKALEDSKGEKYTGDELDDRINQILYEIKVTKAMFDDIYNRDESAQEYGNCIGDIDLNLLKELVPPVNLTIGQEITFSGTNNYGLYKGMMHNGVDLEESSTNTMQGDEVYSLYDGRVFKSTVDGTYDDENANGGWLVIDYYIQYTDNTLNNSKFSSLFKNKISKIRVYYGGLDSNTLTLKQNDIVSKGQTIGNVGDASMSETGEKPSVHFAIYDLKARTFLNPINMFITCNAVSGGVCFYNSSGGAVYDIPQSVLNYKQINYDVECYSEEFGWGCKSSWQITPGTSQKKVQELWISSGKKYTNGIATVNVNGVDRYLAATTLRFGQPGDVIDATLENGEVIPIIIDDTKSYCHTKSQIANSSNCNKQEVKDYCDSSMTDPGCFGHFKNGKSLGVLEFAANPTEYTTNAYKSPSKWGQVWDTSQKVVSITNYGSLIGETSTGTCQITNTNLDVGKTGTTTPNARKNGRTYNPEHNNTNNSGKRGTANSTTTHSISN